MVRGKIRRLKVTTFGHTKNPHPLNVREFDWLEFVEFVERNGHERCDAKEDQALFGLYELKPDTSRKNANVREVYGWTLDLDKLKQEDVDKVLDGLRRDGLAFLVYSTFSHSQKQPKLRVLGPLARPVPGADWKPVWRAIVDRYSPGADEQCKDAARIFHYPSAPPDGEVVLFSSPGKPLEPPAVQATPKKSTSHDDFDLDTRDIIDSGLKLDRCPQGSNPFEYGEQLCRTMPPALAGSGGSIALLRVARALVWGLAFPPEQAVDLIGEIYNPRCEPAWSEAEIEHKVEDAQIETGAAYKHGALLPIAPETYDELAPIVQNGGRYWVRMPNSNDYSRRCSKDDLGVVIRKHWSAGTHEMYVDAEDMPKPAELAKHTEPVNTIVTCYYSSKSTFDPTTEILRQGLRMDPEIKPTFDADVDKWLAAYGGEQLDDLKRWIAACRADRLKAPARALAVVGKKGLGKSLVAFALARLWNADAVPADVLCQRFNGALEYCPIVLADERLPEELTGEAFRQVIAARRHSIEPKGKERHTLEGCIRMVVTANSIDKLHLLGSKGRDDVDAIADRFFLLHIPEERAQACYDAQQGLLDADGSTIDIGRMAAHFRLIQDTVEPAAGRFIGTLGDGGAREATLGAETERAPEVFDVLRAFLTDGWGSDYKPTVAGIPRRGEVVPEAKRNAPLVVKDARLYARVAVLGQIVGREQREVATSLKPFVLAKRAPFELAGVTFDAVELDPFALIQSLDLDADRVGETLMTDTADRHTPGPT